MDKLSLSDDVETIYFKDAAAFDTWLAQHHTNPAGVWMKMAKKDSGIPSITSNEAVDIGLCWGWISGQRKPLDSQYYLQKYVPRRPRSVWSQINVEKVEALTIAGKMQSPGIAEVEAAKADGRWQAAYVSQRNAIIPEDLANKLAAHPKARHAFDKLNKTEQYAIILQLAKIRSQEKRVAKIEAIIRQLEAV